MKRPSESSEHAEQCAVMSWARLHEKRWPALRLLHAVPNGAFFGGEVKTFASGKKVPVAAIRARKLKAEGLREGVPDLCLPAPSGVAHRGLYIEMKRRKGGVSSPMQTWWRKCLILMGYRAELCHGAEEAIDVLKSHVMHSPTIPWPELPPERPARQPASARKPRKARGSFSFLLPPRP
jgi:hypothetical protein